ncbi:MAG: hypothetical protein B7Z02_17095 [Rhodobacterales bacterium 32-67-9]|nr:MAG: hypothetical protein B7Z02_17095 [Rhodobacterales bacterium 32-67-9]
MSRIVILGAGVMSTAFATPLSDNGFDVDLVGTHLDRDHVDAMKASREHPRLRARIGERVTPRQIESLSEVLATPPDLLVVGVSTPGIGWATEQLLRHMTGRPPVIFLTKGISDSADRIEILPDLVGRSLAQAGKDHGPLGAVGGPCIAGELAVRRQTSAIIGFRDEALAADWAARLSTGYYHLSATDDLVGLEICAALKNFFAIGVSVPRGRLAEMPAPNGAALHNEVASLFNQAVTELARIVGVGGGRPATAYGLAGLGDLHVTTQAGRNSKLGVLIGEGLSYAEAMAGPLNGETVEGAIVARSLRAPLAAAIDSGQLTEADLPLAHLIVESVAGKAAFKVDFAAFH